MTAGRILSVGECMLELAPQADGSWRLGHAGDSFNVVWALRALLPADWRTGYFTVFGDDPFSEEQRRFMASAGVETAESPVLEGARPGLYAIQIREGERYFTYWRQDSAARRLAADGEALARAFADRRLIYFSGITLAILPPEDRTRLLEALARAREAGALIAFDPNYRPRLWASPQEARAAMEAALKIVEIALPTFPDEAALFGDSDPAATKARLAALGVPEILVKDGAQEALAYWPGGEIRAAPKGPVDLVDPTGAGDSFNGGYLAARLLGAAPPEALAAAHRVAGRVVGVRGALADPEILRKAFAQGA